jgi:hypothetical protein
LEKEKKHIETKMEAQQKDSEEKVKKLRKEKMDLEDR